MAHITHDTIHSDTAYDTWLTSIQQRFAAMVSRLEMRLFTTDASGLFQAYLSGFDDGPERQYHNCHACRHFFERYGGLAFLDKRGFLLSAVWELTDTPACYRKAVQPVITMVEKARITGPFFPSLLAWGTPETCQWHHFSIQAPQNTFCYGNMLTASQAMAEKQEDYRILCRGLADFDEATLAQAVRLLETEGALHRAEKVLGPARWLLDLHKRRAATQHRRIRENLTWYAVATAPPGFCHPRTTMIGSLLEDIAAGLAYNDIAAKFKAKMGWRYQRPQAAPTAGNIAQAEKIVEKLGIANSLRRRFARLEEIAPHALWVPRPRVEATPKSREVFSHLHELRQKVGVPYVTLPRVVMTWEKFQREVLPKAKTIEYYTSGGNDNYIAFITAVDMDAPPILQWDTMEYRNPVSRYVYQGGSPPGQWGLGPYIWYPVTAITGKAHTWSSHIPSDHHSDALILLLEGAQDRAAQQLGLFPEILKTELRNVRATIEAYSQKGQIEGKDEASACGIAFQKGDKWACIIRVTSEGQAQEYCLDRWD